MNSEPLPFGDLNHDCVVDVFDLEILANNFGKTIDFDLRVDTDCDRDVDGADLYLGRPQMVIFSVSHEHQEQGAKARNSWLLQA